MWRYCMDLYHFTSSSSCSPRKAMNTSQPFFMNFTAFPPNLKPTCTQERHRNFPPETFPSRRLPPKEHWPLPRSRLARHRTDRSWPPHAAGWLRDDRRAPGWQRHPIRPSILGGQRCELEEECDDETRDTPPKTKMEHEKDGFQKESPFPGVHFQVPC